MLAQQRTRTVAAFEAALTALEGRDALAAKAAAGDTSAGIDLLLADITLGRVSRLAQAKRRLMDLGKPSAEQQKRLDVHFVDWEMNDIVRSRGKTADKTKKIVAMYEAGRIPTGTWAGYFWRRLLDHADKTGNAAILGRALEESIKISFGRYAKRLEQLRDK